MPQYTDEYETENLPPREAIHWDGLEQWLECYGSKR